MNCEFTAIDRASPNISKTENTITRRFWSDGRGAMLVWLAITLPALFGMTGLGVDATLWYMHKRIAQTASDSGAVAAAQMIAKSRDEEEARAAALAAAERNRFEIGPNDQMDVFIPPNTGPQSGNAGFAEVVVTKRAPLYFSTLFREEPVIIRARAVAGSLNIGQHCVLGLDPTMDGTVEFRGNANANISCGVASNSNSSTSLLVDGSATLTADPAQAYGDILVKGSADLITARPPQSLSQRVPDPYGPEGRNLEPPIEPVACTETGGTTVSGTVTLTPGRYCGGLRFLSTDATLMPGVYIIDGGDFEIGSSASVVGEGITIILTADDPEDIGNAKITGGPDIHLTAPGPAGQPDYDGAFAGILLFQDRRAPSVQGGNLIDNTALGNAFTDLRGVLYFPSQEVVYSGGADAAERCLQIVARKVTFSGDSTINNTPDACDAQGVDTIGLLQVRLTE